jgi:hypothetical protein
MPNRILRDGIIESERVNTLSCGAELLYRRLMSKVDDYGRFYANPSLILAACYPLQLDRVSPSNVSAWLAECGQLPANVGEPLPLVTSYEVNGKKYLQINNFGQRTRSESRFPPPIVREARSIVSHMTDNGELARARSETAEAKTAANANANAETDKTAAAAETARNGHSATSWRLAAAAVQSVFEKAEDGIIEELASLGQHTLQKIGSDPALLTDQVLADALKTAHFDGQRSAKGYFKTLPVVIRNWAKPKDKKHA